MINFAYAQTSAQQPSMFASFIPLILIFLIFYFLLIRPQQKKQKEHRLLLDAIKRGDEIDIGIYSHGSTLDNMYIDCIQIVYQLYTDCIQIV